MQFSTSGIAADLIVVSPASAFAANRTSARISDALERARRRGYAGSETSDPTRQRFATCRLADYRNLKLSRDDKGVRVASGYSPPYRSVDDDLPACLLSLSSALFVGSAAAQTLPWPIINGRQLQPTQQQVDGKRDEQARQSDRDFEWQLDRLYDELLQSSSPRGR